MKTSDSKEDGEVIYTKTIKTRSGKILYAAAYGLKAFRIVVKNKKK